MNNPGEAGSLNLLTNHSQQVNQGIMGAGQNGKMSNLSGLA